MDQLLLQNLASQESLRASFASLQAKLQHEFEKALFELETEAVSIEDESVTEHIDVSARRFERLDLTFDDLMEKTNQRLFEKAIEKGHLSQIRYFLKNTDVKLKMDENKIDALCLAVNAKQVESLRLLLSDPRSNPFADDHCAIRMALTNKAYDIVQVFLAYPETNLFVYHQLNEEMDRVITGGHDDILRTLIDLRNSDGKYLFDFKLLDGGIAGRLPGCRFLELAVSFVYSGSVDSENDVNIMKLLLNSRDDEGLPRFSWLKNEIDKARKCAVECNLVELIKSCDRYEASLL